jgi:hypothetical protein
MDESSLSTELPGNLPLWITRVGTFLYINDAKIVRGDRKVKLGQNNLEQIVHVMDKVLEPTLPKVDVGGSSKNNPDAKKFLQFSNEFTITGKYTTS